MTLRRHCPTELPDRSPSVDRRRLQECLMSFQGITRRIVLAGIAASPLPVRAQSEDWPTKRSITAVIPFAAGSSTDVIARAVLDELSKRIGQTIVVENRAGASGTIGAGAVAK